MRRFFERYNLDKIDVSVCVVSFLIGLVLRILGYNWDGGHMIFQADETNMVFPAVYFVQNKQLYDKFTYPAQFFSKIQGIVLWQYVRATQAKLGWYMVDAYLICRIVTAVVGALTIFTVFLIGNYLHKRLGTVTTVILALSPMMVMMSKQVTGDVTSLFLTSCVMLFALRYTEDQKKRYLVLMSLFAAMATMEKWHGGAAGVFIGVMVLLYAKSVKDFLGRGIIALVTYVIGIVCIAPNLLFHMSEAVDQFFVTAVWDNADNPSYLENLVGYFNGSSIGLGYVYIIATILGLVLVLLQKDKRYAVLLLGPIKTLMMCVMNRIMPRWGLELYLSQMILIAFAICLMWEYHNRIIKVVAVAAMVTVIIESSLATAFVDAIAMAYDQDIRCLQEQYCSENGIEKERTISARYTAFVPGNIRADVEGEVVTDNCDNIFEIKDGEIYKLQDFDYYVWSNRTNVKSIIEKLDEKQLCIWQKKREYNDIFFIPYNNAGKREKTTRNDFLLCKDYIAAINNVKNGAIRGAYNISIYDISGLKLKTD